MVKRRNSTKKTVRVTEPADNSCRTRCCGCFRDNLLLILLILGVGFGVALGVVLRLYVPPFQQPELHPREMMYLNFPAEIFIRIMTLISLPLIVSSLISAIGSLDAKSSGKVGLMVLCYYVGTTVLAVCQGFAFVYAIKPGQRDAYQYNNVTQKDGGTTTFENTNRLDSLLDMIRNIFPDSIMTMTFQLHSTHVTLSNVTADVNSTVPVEKFENIQVESMNILGITVTSLVFGAALSTTGSKGRLLFCVFDAIFDTIMKIIRVLFWLYPMGVVFMTAGAVVEMKDPVQMMKSMLFFLLTVIFGVLTHLLVTLPLLFLILARRNPYKHLYRCMKALFTAFATSNSNMTVPVTMDCLQKAGYNSNVIRFMVPIGATVNMDGFALYEAIAAIFIATLNGMNPGAVQVLTLGLTAVAVSIGAPTAGSGIVLYIILFKSIGLPIRDIFILLPFDPLLSRLRTSCNVWGDCVGVGVIHRLARGYVTTAPHTDNEDGVSHSSGDELDEPEEPVLTRFSQLGHRPCSVKLLNENGDSIYVSKV